MRKTLGGRLAIVALTVLSTACVSVNGRLVPAWGHGGTSCGCGLQPSQLGKADLQIVVYLSGSGRGSADQANVDVFRDSEPTSMHFTLPLQRRVVAAEGLIGYATDSTHMPLGSWVVSVGLPFERPVRRKVNLKPNSLCVVQVVLRAHA